MNLIQQVLLYGLQDTVTVFLVNGHETIIYKTDCQ